MADLSPETDVERVAPGGDCVCCRDKGRLPPSQSGIPGMIDGEVLRTMCDPCISAAFLGGGLHPHPIGDAP